MAVIAGKVAPRFMGAYNSSTTYQFYDAVTYSNKLYFCKVSGTVGKTPSGATDDNWFLSIDGTFTDAASLGGETASQWQTKIDNIQTASRATLSTAGWYRVAKLDNDYSNSCRLSFGNVYTYNVPEVHEILFDASFNKPRIIGISHNSGSSARVFTKIRKTYDGANYLEVYYAPSNPNSCCFNVLSNVNFGSGGWQAITPTLTSETVDGVTVTTTYDIPANASPVTDLDIANVRSEVLRNSESILEKAKTLSYGMWNFRFTDHDGTDLPSNTYVYGMATVFVRTSSAISVYLWGGSVAKNMASNHWNGTSWTGWVTNATAADLANYLPKNGTAEYVKAQYGSEFNLNGLTGVSDMWFNFRNGDTANADTTPLTSYTFGDKTMNYDVISLDLTEGSGKRKILHSGNVGSYALALNGGAQIITGSSQSPLAINSTTDDTVCMMPFRKKGTTYGSIGFNAQDSPIVYSATLGTQSLLHTGNSAKVAIQSSAPTDTTALWVDTTNKKTKAYIDGAWTVIA